jgi:hypothetical protein
MSKAKTGTDPDEGVEPESDAPASAPADPIMAERYGRSPGERRRLTIWIASIAAVLLIAFASWLAWGGLLNPATQIEATDTGNQVLNSSEVSITWDLSVTPNSKTRCALQALNKDFGIVGWKVVDIPASPVRTRSFSATIRTSEQSVTGLIYRCWLT